MRGISPADLYRRTVLISDSNVKGKGHPRTDHKGPEEEWKYSSTFSLTSALDGGGWSRPRPGRFTVGKDPVLIV